MLAQGSGVSIDLDCAGLACPGPIMKLADTMKAMNPGDDVVVHVSDPGFALDGPAWARRNGHELLAITPEGSGYVATIRKSGATVATAGSAVALAPVTPKLSFVVFSGDLDKVIAAFIIANGAVAMGEEVSMFFTFWGLNALRKEQAVSASGKTLLDKMFGKMMPRGLGKLGLSKMNMAGIGNPMFTWRMKQLDLPNPHGLLDAARKGGIRIVACSMSMDAMGLKKEELLDGVEIGGVADFLGAAETTGTNLFI
jgi:peroxiredoxin family protein/TusA-related sulfurtransferase